MIMRAPSSVTCARARKKARLIIKRWPCTYIQLVPNNFISDFTVDVNVIAHQSRCITCILAVKGSKQKNMANKCLLESILAQYLPDDRVAGVISTSMALSYLYYTNINM